MLRRFTFRSIINTFNPLKAQHFATMASEYPQRKIGDDSVSAQGLGCMGMSFAYTSFGGYDDKESHDVLSKALELGINFWDTSDVYVCSVMALLVWDAS